MLNLIHYIWIFLGPPLSIYIMILISGDFKWYYGILFLIITTLSIYIISIYLIIYNKELLLERFNFKSDDQEIQDQLFINKIGKYLFTLFYLIIPLTHRYSFFGHYNDHLVNISCFMVVISYILIFLVFKNNSYASPIIRNQKERNHTIITTGLYAYVRHPMYTACIIIFIFTPLMLNSILGSLFGIYLSIIFCKRITIEEIFLCKEFESYKSYKDKVKYKIFPYFY